MTGVDAKTGTVLPFRVATGSRSPLLEADTRGF